MKPFSLCLLNPKCNRLNFGVVLLLVCWLGLSQLSAWHNPAHSLQADNHCALCFSSSSNEHALVNAAIDIAPHSSITVQPDTPLTHLVESDTYVNGNRDPPTSA